MDLLANDLSIHGQFHEIASFRAALGRLMAMRVSAQRYGREVRCHRALLTVSPFPGVPMQQAISRLSDKNECRAVMGWLTRTGPFWDDLRQHDSEDYLESRGEIVTDTAVGEAAFRTLHDIKCDLISVTPSDWDFPSVEVTWRREAEGLEDRATFLENWRDVATLENELRDSVPPIQSWDELCVASEKRFESLSFAGNCFEPLKGVPFAKSAAERFLFLLGILDRFACDFDANGGRTPEGQRIYQDYFTGENALFSDSSNTEKNNFRKELTFPNPGNPEDSLFCTWHGKVRHMTLRLHLSWPVEAGNPIYIVYAGPKITKR